jgi:protein-arginine kinase activator protein McsA
MDEASHTSVEFEAAKAAASQGEESDENEGNKKATPLDALKLDLEQAVAEERYEDAARLRDEIKRLEEKHTDN